MTAMAIPSAGASSDFANWGAIDWRTVEVEVKRLQMRIAKAIREGTPTRD
jgi:RNA-directed DNA polymerase